MSDIKIFMCCHKPFEFVPPMCTPIQCGSSLHEKIKGAVYDDSGENISSKNPEYCELTAHYYAWKNVSADYYGFCHYRRFFCFDESVSKPYLAKKGLSEKNVKLLGTEKLIRTFIEGNDMIVPRCEDMGVSVRRHYETSQYHFAEDLDLFEKILADKFPYLKPFAENYFSQTKQYFCNMFVMKRDMFFDYCEKLFGILSEFDKRKSLHGDFQSNRTDGFLGEIFTGIYINYRHESGAEILKLPRIDINCNFKKRVGYLILPPESKRRFFVKRIVKGLKG
ncbi:MAG: DUF4422 domain-containing protein [Oscillospiraceae bacterium]|nr:DUF4422 domain-containing protein [Oscillospiraceae bacterium]